ncbi:MAG: polyribonucleotide nucleotidyltransferase [Firmicutes bacterium]|nr:polyribonucleotide nucleotidyltransferase [Bacillota bacterium]
MEQFRFVVGDRPLVLEVGKLAKQANGAVTVRYGDTVVLVTATMSKEPRAGIDFFPLLVDYEERMYAVGKIPGGWGRREGRPSEQAILAARMIDRPLRPLFPEGFRNDVHVVATVLSVDMDNSPSLAAVIGASAALHISNIPFSGPVAAVQIGRVNGEFVINPTLEQSHKSDLDLVVAGTKDAVMMVEAGANEVTEDVVLEAIMFGHEAIKELCIKQDEMREAIGVEKIEVTLFEPEEAIVNWVREKGLENLKHALNSADKKQREDSVEQVRQGLEEMYLNEFGEEKFEEDVSALNTVFQNLMKEEVRRLITEEAMRPDGRNLDEIRPVSCEVGILPRTHGSGLFTRGQTQVLTVCTLGLKSDEQMLDNLTDEDRKRYIHHYNFPGFSVGEVRPVRGPGRREIGHGALAERALLPVIPQEDEFPYTLRLVSEVLESNGSSSQASVCGSTLALMDAGVPIKRPVAGIAMGLVKYGEKFAILTDIQGLEDALGDMDFKVAGTHNGITALQMDIKISGVSREILADALEQAKRGRFFILEKMAEAIAEPRPELSRYAPRIITFEVPVDKIRDIIGPGGKTIRQIIDETGVQIDIADDGRVYIASVEEEAGEKARKLIETFVKDVEVGESYLGKVKRLMNFGAFVEILPGKEGLVHISQLSHERVNKVEDVVSVGDEILVKVTEIDKQGRINLSRKELLTKENSN